MNTAIETASSAAYSSMKTTIDNWIAFDLEWEIEPKPLDNATVSNTQQTLNNAVFTSGTSMPPAEDYHKILTFGYEDSYGNNGTFDISDFMGCPNPEKGFLEEIKTKLLQYKYCFAWGSKAVKHKNENSSKAEGINGDLVILGVNFRQNGIPSIIRYDKFSKIPYIKNIGSIGNGTRTTDIDLLQVFAKPLVKYVMFKNKYKSLKLQEVAIQLLGYGKLDNKSGSNILHMSAEERKSYCKHDAHLVAELVKINNGDILKIMQVIANHTGLKIEDVCHKGMTGIWTKILNDAIYKKAAFVGYDNLPFTLRKLYSNKHEAASRYDWIEEDVDEWQSEDEDDDIYDTRDNQEDEDRWYSLKSKLPDKTIQTDKSYRKYKGAIVLHPVRGLHLDVYVFDVTSLYPTIIIKYSLSPETINCPCCKNDSQAQENITPEILNDCSHIPTKDAGRYWICRRRRGLFAKILQDLTDQRIKYKNAGLEVESQAIKAIINSGYGVFGHPYFKYYDPRVAELVTGFGRYTLNNMRAIADELGFCTLYGDTDSLFVNNVKSVDENNKFIAQCKSKLGVDLTCDKTFSKLILVGKKHYIGIPSDPTKDPIIKGMEGVKSDRPEFIHKVFRQLVENIKNGVNPIPKIKESLYKLENKQVSPDLLAISLVMRKNPEEYDQYCKQRKLGSKLGLHKGDTLVYYKCDINEITFDSNKKEQHIQRRIYESENPQEISYSEYKKMLVNSVKDVLQILGYDVNNDLQLSDIISTANSIATVKDSDPKERKRMVSEGIDTLFSLFVAVGQRLFPRAIMTKCTKGQVIVQNKEKIMYYFEASNYEDCRINAYPALSKREEQEHKGVDLNLFAPNILFIDLDAKKFSSNMQLERALKQILNHIGHLLHDCKPLVLWSGHGYHIIIPVNCKEALEHFQELSQYRSEPSKDFLQFSERRLSLSKADPANNPSLKSCLLRVPYTFNSECLAEGTDAEVNLVQQWDSSIQLPNVNNLVVEFQTFLVDRKLKAERKQEKLKSRRPKDSARNQTNNNIIPWIERLFEIAIEHNREYCVWRIFAPYLINIKNLEHTHAYDMIKDWLDRCDSIRKLDFDSDYQIKYTLEKAISVGYLPISFEDLKMHNPDLYKYLLFP